MIVQEVFNLGLEFYTEGKTNTAMEIWDKLVSKDPNFGPVYLNQHNVYRSQGNLVKAREALLRYLNCPITGISMDAIPAIKAQIQEIEKQLTPQVVQPPR